jgi:hypothetical protein
MSSYIKEFLDQTKRRYLAKPFSPGELRSLVKQCSLLIKKPIKAAGLGEGVKVHGKHCGKDFNY